MIFSFCSLAMGFFIRYALAVLFFSEPVFGTGLELPKSRGSIRKKRGAPLSEHAFFFFSDVNPQMER